ncbi:MAG: hypothetical protein AAF737_03735 [Pseudomonadota bacterium]
MSTNSPSVPSEMDAMTQTSPDLMADMTVENPLMPHRLRRTGMRPMNFTGRELCSAMSYASGTPLWYEINLYQTHEGSFVVDVRMFSKSEDERDMHRAVEVHDVDAMFDWLEAHDPIADIDCDCMVLATDSLSPTEVALRAADLRMRVDEGRRQYRDLVGQILYDLDMSA